MLLLGYPRLISIIHLFIIVPILVSLALDKFPQQYKKYLLLLAVYITFAHLYRLYKMSDYKLEGLENLSDQNIHHIRIFDSSPGYEFPILTVKKGDVVVWTNIGEVTHTVTACKQEFNSDYMKPGDRFAVRFTERGEIDYYCMEHRGWMIGKIIVV